MPVSPEFDAAVLRSKSLPPQPTATQPELYGLFKQASLGDVTGDRPGVFDPKGRAKWDAWSKLRGQSSEAAQAAYIALIGRLGAT